MDLPGKMTGMAATAIAAAGSKMSLGGPTSRVLDEGKENAAESSFGEGHQGDGSKPGNGGGVRIDGSNNSRSAGGKGEGEPPNGGGQGIVKRSSVMRNTPPKGHGRARAVVPVRGIRAGGTFDRAHTEE